MEFINNLKNSLEETDQNDLEQKDRELIDKIRIKFAEVQDLIESMKHKLPKEE